MKKYLLLVVVLGLAVGAFAQSAKVNGPVIAFEKKTHDFGQIVQGEAFEKAMAAPGFAARRAAAGLHPSGLTGPELQAFVERSLGEYRALAAEFGLPVR